MIWILTIRNLRTAIVTRRTANWRALRSPVIAIPSTRQTGDTGNTGYRAHQLVHGFSGGLWAERFVNQTANQRKAVLSPIHAPADRDIIANYPLASLLLETDARMPLSGFPDSLTDRERAVVFDVLCGAGQKIS